MQKLRRNLFDESFDVLSTRKLNKIKGEDKKYRRWFHVLANNMNHASFDCFAVGVFVLEPSFPRIGARLNFATIVIAIPESFGIVGFPNDFAPTVIDF